MSTKHKVKAVTYRHTKGRYVTTDGLAFTTMEQAERYCEEKNREKTKTEKQ